MTVTLTRCIEIMAPQSLVFEAATNWPRQHEWMVGTTVRATHLDGRETGGKIEAFTGFLKIGLLDTMTITDWQPPSLCKVIHTGKIVKGTGTFKVNKINDTISIFEWTEDIVLPLGIVGKVGWFIVRPFASYGVSLSLKRFKNWVESRY